ncbi:methyltransferase domain-containing protein [Amycolatopsis samaneae]|uniref:Protein-L-isoaspartate O-methyltransferase n=1 Tax=Amycolatopsis samaneae TaxID=664691 RepID=A0ABW5GFJ8_9PSEU
MSKQQHLAAALSEVGKLPLSWANVFAEVDRAAFVPAKVWFDDEHGHPQPIGRDTDPVRWQAAVYSNEPVVTQLDHGRTVWPDTSLLVTSSTSQPSMMLIMLDALDVHEGHTVLEIGTGTGYNTALLCQRLGDDHVTTIEVDPALATWAREALSDAGYRPWVVCGDGATGWPPGAPYDRVIATAAVMAGRLPYAWIEQTRPGGQILTPWGTAYDNGVLVRLTVHGDGTASGPVVGEAAFMRLRSHDIPLGHAARLGDIIDTSTSAATTTTTVPPDEVAMGDGAFSVGLHLPDVRSGVFYDDGPEHYEVLLYHVPSDSVASVKITPETTATGRYSVRQHGPRRLWDEAETAHTWWTDHGRPAQTRYGLTISRTQQQVWLDQPSTMVTSAVPAA